VTATKATAHAAAATEAAATHVAAASTAALRKRRPGAYCQRTSEDERLDE
jgi:hypothetical protein